MLRIKNSKNNLVSIGQYKIIDILKESSDKDIYHVKDLKKPFKEFTLRILKDHQSAKKINNELEVLNILNKYQETLHFHNVQILSDKLLFLYDYSNGENLQRILEKDSNFFNQEKILFFIDNILEILNIYRQNHIIHHNITLENILFNGEKYYLIGLSNSYVSKVDKKKFDNSKDMSDFSNVLTKILEKTKDINIEEIEKVI